MHNFFYTQQWASPNQNSFTLRPLWHCDESSCRILERQQFLNEADTYFSQKSIAIIQEATNEGVNKNLCLLLNSDRLTSLSRRSWKKLDLQTAARCWHIINELLRVTLKSMTVEEMRTLTLADSS